MFGHIIDASSYIPITNVPIDDVDAGAVFEVEPDEGFDIGFGASATGASVGSAVGFLSDSVCGN